MTKSIFTAIILSTFYLGSLADGGFNFSYVGLNGPNYWSRLFPEFCSGRSQSPIGIVKDIIIPSRLGTLVFNQYDQLSRQKLIMTNDGHTIKITFPDNAPQTISGGSIAGTYRLMEINFHWGAKPHQGSEHALFSRSFPLEMQLIHRNIKYTSFDELRQPDSLVAVALLFETQPYENDALKPIISQLSTLRECNSSVSISGFNLRSLLPTDLTHFYRYHGSLTTPDCAEIVTWIVLGRYSYIESDQLAAFLDIKDEMDRPLVNNFRTPQNMNGRVVLWNSP